MCDGTGAIQKTRLGRTRQYDAERGAAARPGADRDLAPLCLCQVFNDREAEPRAAEVAGARLVDAVETLEDARQVLGRDADPLVLHLEPHLAAALGDAHREAPP